MKLSSAKIWNAKYPAAQDIDAFIKVSPKQAQAKMKQLRQLIRTMVPKATEAISYRMPAFKLDGKAFAAFAGYEHHLGFYFMSGSLLAKFKKELKNYETSKGAIRFPLDKPLPAPLIKKLIKARIKVS